MKVGIAVVAAEGKFRNGISFMTSCGGARRTCAVAGLRLIEALAMLPMR